MREYAWAILVIAGLFEMGWAVGLKNTHGFTRLGWTIATIIMIAISMGLLGVAARYLPLGTAYAVWTGIGAVGTVVMGILLFGESAAPLRMVCVGLIVAGIAGLKFLAH